VANRSPRTSLGNLAGWSLLSRRLPLELGVKVQTATRIHDLDRFSERKGFTGVPMARVALAVPS
jgi:hypothetical protein